jgi:predicted RNA-binding Zn-ribbon protein involved in translation (DUF1610 family)
MKIKKCPRCGETLIEEVNESNNQGSCSTIGSSISATSIEVYLAPNTRFRITVYRCPNVECGYLSTDC